MSKEISYICASDTLCRDKTVITPEALMKGLWDGCIIGIPNALGHDIHRIVGWLRPRTLHFEPGLTRLLGVAKIAEDKAEQDQLVQYANAYLYHELVEKRNEDITTLRSIISPYLAGEEKITCSECVAYTESGLARRVFHQLFNAQDADGLVPISLLTPLQPGIYCVGDLLVFAHRYYRRSFSHLNSLNVPFLDTLQRASQTNTSVKISLDPDLVGLASSLKFHVEHIYWWGPTFNDDLANITPGVTRHEASEVECALCGISRTEVWWQSRKGEHILEAEEIRDLPAPEDDDTYHCRYVHGIVRESDRCVIHFDGAVRSYTLETMAERLDVTINNQQRNTTYTKLWRIDDNIDIQLWKRLISDYYRDNTLIGEYLGAEEENISVRKLPTATSELSRVSPIRIDQRTGIRLAVTCSPWVVEDAIGERWIVATEGLDNGSNGVPVIDESAVELRKIITRYGGTVALPEDAAIISCQDLKL